MPVDDDLLHKNVSGDTMKGKLIFNIFIVISSKPCEFFHLRDLIISLISLVDTGVNFICGNSLINT